jgi:hypothetical protein
MRGILPVVVLVLLAGACHTTADTWAPVVARSQMDGFISAAAMARSEVEVRPSRDGWAWAVIFHDANLDCGADGPAGPGACRGVHFGEVVYRDAYTCVPRVIGITNFKVGASQQRIGPNQDPCSNGP